MSANIDAVLARLDEMNNGEINYEVYRELHDLVSAIEDDVQAPIELAQLMAERDAGKQAEAERAAAARALEEAAQSYPFTLMGVGATWHEAQKVLCERAAEIREGKSDE